MEIQEPTFPKWKNCQRQILFPSTFPLSFPFISSKITFTRKSSFDFNVAEFAPWQLLLPPRFSQIALRTSWLPSDFLHSVSQFFCKESFEFMLKLSFSKIASRISSLPVQIFLQGCFDIVSKNCPRDHSIPSRFSAKRVWNWSQHLENNMLLKCLLIWELQYFSHFYLPSVFLSNE